MFPFQISGAFLYHSCFLKSLKCGEKSIQTNLEHYATNTQWLRRFGQKDQGLKTVGVYIHMKWCHVTRVSGNVDQWGEGDVGEGRVTYYRLAIYKNGAYKNVQVSSCVAWKLELNENLNMMWLKSENMLFL